LRDVLERVKRRYHLRVPPKVIMADYDEKEGDLYIRFSEAEKTEGEPSKDGLVIVHRNRKNAIVAIEILNLSEL
jgi:uncharacterized protein YuzE